MIYFKKVGDDRLADPGPDLTRVLDFKSRISSSVLYKEFTDDTSLEDMVEEALADWVHDHHGSQIESVSGPSGVVAEDLDVLAFLSKGAASIEEIQPQDVAG